MDFSPSSSAFVGFESYLGVWRLTRGRILGDGCNAEWAFWSRGRGNGYEKSGLCGYAGSLLIENLHIVGVLSSSGATMVISFCLQNYVNSLCDDLESEEEKTSKFSTSGSTSYSLGTGEDSSYDSDYDGSEEQTHGHDDVSRTVSDTLGQEFSEYVSTSVQSTVPATANTDDSAYQSRVEFALKLGYTEKLVQAALQKLGPNPEQNELLAVSCDTIRFDHLSYEMAIY